MSVVQVLGLQVFMKQVLEPTPIRAIKREHDPIFGHMVRFNWKVCSDFDDPLLKWLEANIEGRHGVDYQRRNYRTSFLRPEDADLCYLAFA